MENLSHLIAQLWTVLTTRAQALSNVWNGFHDFPEFLPRKIYASLARELSQLESLLRRKILHDAQQIQITLEPERPKQTRAAPKPSRAPSEKKDAETVPHRFLPFRFDDGATRAGQPFQRPRILSFDAIMAMPSPVKKIRAETLGTTRLFRRLESFYVAIDEIDVLAEKLSKRLARNDRPRLKRFKASKPFKRWAELVVRIDLAFAGIDLPNRRFDTS